MSSGRAPSRCGDTSKAMNELRVFTDSLLPSHLSADDARLLGLLNGIVYELGTENQSRVM